TTAKSESPPDRLGVMAQPAATTLPSLAVPAAGYAATAWAAASPVPTPVVATPPVPNVGSSAPPESKLRSSRASSRGRQEPGRMRSGRRTWLKENDHMGMPPIRFQERVNGPKTSGSLVLAKLPVNVVFFLMLTEPPAMQMA